MTYEGERYIMGIATCILTVILANKGRNASVYHDSCARQSLKSAHLSAKLENQTKLLEDQIQSYTRAGKAYHKAAEHEFDKAHADETESQNDRERARVDQDHANQDYSSMKRIDGLLQQQEEWHTQLLTNISEHAQENEEEYGVCSWAWLRPGCNLVGHVANLQRHNTSVLMAEIRGEMASARQTEQLMMLEEVSIEWLKKDAQTYQSDADLWIQQAEFWHIESVKLFSIVQQENQTAEGLDSASQTASNLLHQRRIWLTESRQSCRKWLERTHHWWVYQNWYDVISAILAMLVLLFFGRLLYFRVRREIGAWEQSPASTLVTYGGHWVVFGLALSLVVGDDWFRFIMMTRLEKAGVVILFAAVATAIEGFFATSYRKIADLIARRMWEFIICRTAQFTILRFVWYLIDFLLVWLLTGNWTDIWSSRWRFQIPGWLYMLWWMRKQNQEDGKSAIFFMNGSDREASEASFLTDPSNSSKDIEGVPLEYVSVSSASAGVVFWSETFRGDLARLSLPFELLIMVCMVTVLCIDYLDSPWYVIVGAVAPVSKMTIYYSFATDFNWKPSERYFTL